MQTKSPTRDHSRRLIRIAIAGAAGALLIQSFPRIGGRTAAGSDGARATEDTLRADPAAAAPTMDASLQFRMDEMRERRGGRRLRRQEELRRLTPAERRRRMAPPRQHRQRQRDLNDALERVNNLRRRLGAPDITVER